MWLNEVGGDKHQAYMNVNILNNGNSNKSVAQNVLCDETVRYYTSDVTNNKHLDALSDPLRLYVQNFGGYVDAEKTAYKTLVFRIYDIRFGFNDITSDGIQSFDLTTLFGASETELTGVTFNGSDITNLKAFTPTESGTLNFGIAKAGYKTTQFSINVTVA